MRQLSLLLLILALSACASVERLAIPAADPVPGPWAQHDPDSRQTLDHAAWDAFLARYVAPDAEGVNRVAYAKVAPADRAALESYIEGLEETRIATLNRDEQLAFWINLYNARTVLLILENYPVASIRDIKPTLLALGPWDEPLLRVAGRDLSLNEVEHGIVRPIWNDSRIHYAFNCAAVGCPNLRIGAYEGALIDAKLAAQARAYVNDPRGVSISDDRLTLSKIYSWYREDFGGSDPAILAEIRRYASPSLADRLTDFDSIDAYDYDWALNAR